MQENKWAQVTFLFHGKHASRRQSSSLLQLCLNDQCTQGQVRLTWGLSVSASRGKACLGFRKAALGSQGWLLVEGSQHQKSL